MFNSYLNHLNDQIKWCFCCCEIFISFYALRNEINTMCVLKLKANAWQIESVPEEKKKPFKFVVSFFSFLFETNCKGWISQVSSTIFPVMFFKRESSLSSPFILLGRFHKYNSSSRPAFWCCYCCDDVLNFIVSSIFFPLSPVFIYQRMFQWHSLYFNFATWHTKDPAQMNEEKNRSKFE